MNVLSTAFANFTLSNFLTAVIGNTDQVAAHNFAD